MAPNLIPQFNSKGRFENTVTSPSTSSTSSPTAAASYCWRIYFRTISLAKVGVAMLTGACEIRTGWSLRIKAHLRNLRMMMWYSLSLTHLHGLWNEFAIQMVNYWNTKKGDPVVIILQHAMVKRWGAYVNLQNSLFASKLIINDDLEDIDSYVKSLKENPIQVSKSYSSREDSSRRSISLIDDFPAELDFKSIDELDSINEVMFIFHYRKVSEENEKFWCYSCKVFLDAVIVRLTCARTGRRQD
ncbi:ATP-dependent DNA helicase PIF1, partial [Striga asiatica]